MGVDRTRSAMAAAAAVALLAVAGCTQSAPTENSATGSAAQDAAPTDLEIVAQMPIDGDGNEVKLAAGAV